MMEGRREILTATSSERLKHPELFLRAFTPYTVNLNYGIYVIAFAS